MMRVKQGDFTGIIKPREASLRKCYMYELKPED